MKRKTTELERNLKDLGFKLDHKTYCGKNSDKVLDYVFIRTNGYYEYQVFLNRERTQIVGYGFTNPTFVNFNDMTMEMLQREYDSFENELKEIYDFENQKVKFRETIDLEELSVDFVEDYPFLEESDSYD